MASHVVVLASDLRRTTVKVTPGTYLSDVLEDACKKLNLSSTKFLLKHKQRQVDLSIPFRASGLSPGAKLELVQKSKSPSAIQVALQVPPPEGREIPGGRLIQKFPSDLTIWQVLRQFESGKASNGRNLNITGRGVAEMAGGAATGSGQLYYEIPVLNIMGRELASFPEFQKTLSQLGYNSGNVLIRLSYKKTTQTLFDAMAEISRYFQHADTEEAELPQKGQSSASAAVEQEKQEEQKPVSENEKAPTPAPEAEPASQPTEAVETTPAPQSDEMDVDKPESSDPLEPVTVFLAPSSSTPAAALTPADDTDFTPSITHAQLHQARLQESARNKRLLSDKELEAKAALEQAKLNAVKSVLVKVRFPDNTSSEWQVGPNETGHFLYQAVRHVMAHENQPFHLILPGGKTVIKDDASPKNNLVKGYKITGRVLVNCAWDDSVPANVRKQPFLKASVARQGQEIKIPDIIQPADEKSAAVVPQQKPEKGESSADKIGKKMPKWLKLGKK